MGKVVGDVVGTFGQELEIIAILWLRGAENHPAAHLYPSVKSSAYARTPKRDQADENGHRRIDYTRTGVSNITKAAKFCDVAQGVLGLKPMARLA